MFVVPLLSDQHWGRQVWHVFFMNGLGKVVRQSQGLQAATVIFALASRARTMTGDLQDGCSSYSFGFFFLLAVSKRMLGQQICRCHRILQPSIATGRTVERSMVIEQVALGVLFGLAP
jgi:hypothetical protein